jgi:pimeloyl-ACP methyl ester carboxylesterase
MSMAEDTLRRNLDEVFDPGPGFPDPLLLSRTMAALESAARGADRRPSRGSVRRLFPSLSPTANRVLAGALIMLLLLAAFGALLALQHLFYSPTPARWHGCGGVLQCTSVTVPLDYSNPGTGSIEIATIRKPATDPAHRIGSLVLGLGPGGSGIDFLRQNSFFYNSLNTRFDLVAFDQRGTGRSSPVHCFTNAQIDALNDVDTVLDDPREKQIFINAAMATAQVCQGTSGKLLPFVDTASAARDLDAIRAALGDSRLTYLGFGYATLLGEMYAHLFPTHVRALVLDGVLDPAVAPADAWVDRAAGFEVNLQVFLANCRASASCALGQGSDPGARLTALMSRLDQNPLPVGSRMLGRRLALAGLFYGLDPRNWGQLDAGLSEAANGDGKALLVLADLDQGRQSDGSYTFNPDASTAVGCIDQPVPSEIAVYDRLSPGMAATSPLFGPAFQYLPLACGYWPVKAKGTVAPVTAVGAPPILLVGATDDPAWPYAWAQAVTSNMAGSILLTRDGYGSLSYFRSGCVKLAVDAYVTQTTLPVSGKVCASDYPA